MAKPKITKTTTPKAPKTKTTETSNTPAPATKITRVDNTDWKNSSPAAGGNQTWSEWAKSNPNREKQAARADDRLRKTPRETSKTNRFKEDGETPDPKREAAVEKWKSKQPVFGKGASKSDAEKEERRKKMIKWAKENPNARDNARTTLGKPLTRDGKVQKPAAKPKSKKKGK